MDRAVRRLIRAVSVALVLAFLALVPDQGQSGLKGVPVFFGDAPASSPPLGSWQAQAFRITSSGSISGHFETQSVWPASFSAYQDVLIVQVWSEYVWLHFGDIQARPAGQFVPIFASRSTETWAAFELDARFEVPPREVDEDGGMSLRDLHIVAIWYRVYTDLSCNSLELSYPGAAENGSQDPMIVDHPPARLQGTLGVSGFGESTRYYEWLRANLPPPAATPTTEPPFVSPLTPSLFTSPLE